MGAVDGYYEVFAKDFAALRKKFILQKEDAMKLKLVHEFARKYFELFLETRSLLTQINEWSVMKKRYRGTKDLGEKIDILENFIHSSYICQNNKCPIFDPVGEINATIEFLPYTDIEEAREAFGQDTTDFKNFQKEYQATLIELNNVLKDTFTLYTTHQTERYEQNRETDQLEQSLLLAKKSSEEGLINMNYVGSIEKVIERLVEKKFLTNKNSKDERLPKAQERQHYIEEGINNTKRLQEQFGPDLEKLKKKKKKEKT